MFSISYLPYLVFINLVSIIQFHSLNLSNSLRLESMPKPNPKTKLKNSPNPSLSNTRKPSAKPLLASLEPLKEEKLESPLEEPKSSNDPLEAQELDLTGSTGDYRDTKEPNFKEPNLEESESDKDTDKDSDEESEALDEMELELDEQYEYESQAKSQAKSNSDSRLVSIAVALKNLSHGVDGVSYRFNAGSEIPSELLVDLIEGEHYQISLVCKEST